MFDLLPVLAFLVAYKLRGIYVATAVLMVGMVLLVALSWARRRRVSVLMGVSAALVLLGGGATLLLHDPVFIKWKPTAYFWIMATVFLVSTWIGRQPLAQLLQQSAFAEAGGIARSAWQRVNLAWALFFAALGALNLYVAFRMSENTWVNFKVYGLTALLLVFGLAQALWLARQGAQGQA
ncbi:MAG: septation protein IspZ [Gammaproteobacteria bacterium]|nr:septation protein IspZ [Gammaproteobacteria bacterium]